ncbi:MAG: hypothetical protein LBU07_03255 [Coriobacteriales bacterium]|jgi:uncharacterized membrane protein YphA (DoxX/SURF4 family)|nr:hypothetical protein [Coriobacteriales bacterium]
MEEQSKTIIENLIGVPIPDYALWIALGVVVLIAVLMVAVGFFREINKK